MTKIKVLEMIDKSFLGGGQANLLSLAKALDRSRYDVSICSSGGGPLVEEAEKNGLRHRAVSFKKMSGRKIVKDLSSILSAEKFDVVHTHGGVAGLYGRWAARNCRVPVIVHTLHGIHYLHYRNLLLKRAYILLERLYSRFTDRLIFVSEADKAQGIRYRLSPKNKMAVIKNGIDFEAVRTRAWEDSRSQDVKAEFGWDSSLPMIGTIARLHRQKGLSILLEAAKILIKKNSSTQLIIVGGGPLETRLRNLQRKLGLDQNVIFTGQRKDSLRLLAAMDVFVLSSLWEGLPYALIEAAALSKPVVATDIPGIRELVSHEESGLLVPVRDPQALAQGINRLFGDRDLATKLGSRLRNNLAPRFTLESMVTETQNLYESLLDRRRS